MRKRELVRRLAVTEKLLGHVAETLQVTLQVLGHHFEAHEECGCERQFLHVPESLRGIQHEAAPYN